MAKEDTITIAFPNGGLLPRSVTGENADKPVQPRQAVDVPRRYGEHLISDRFAYEVKSDRPKRKVAAQKSSEEVAIAELKAALVQLRADAAKATSEEDKAALSRQISAAETLLGELDK